MQSKKGNTVGQIKKETERTMRINRKGGLKVLKEKPVITLDTHNQVINVTLGGEVIPEQEWRTYLPLSRYNELFIKIAQNDFKLSKNSRR